MDFFCRGGSVRPLQVAGHASMRGIFVVGLMFSSTEVVGWRKDISSMFA